MTIQKEAQHQKAVKPLYYSRKEVSIITGISVGALSQMALRGEGPECLKPEGYGCTLYPIDKLHEWLDAGARKTTNSTDRGGARARIDQQKRKGRLTKKEEVARRKRAEGDT